MASRTIAVEVEQLDAETVAQLARSAIRHPGPAAFEGDFRYHSLDLLGLLHPRFTLAVVADLVWLAPSDKHHLQVLTLLGRLSKAEAEAAVAPAVSALLPEADYFDLLRYGGLLMYLGLMSELKELVDYASASDDPETRQLGPEYFPEVLT